MGSAPIHSRFSPSTAERWMTCPGSVVLSEGMPEDESEYAAEGTRAHAFAERWLLMHFAQHGASPFIGSADEEMAKHVKVYIDECIRLNTKGSKVFTEKRVSLSDDVYGTADFILWRPDMRILYVRDLKYGSGVVVNVERNIQLRIYALAALVTMKLPAALVNIGIVQPRYDHPDGSVRSIDFDLADLLDLHADVLDAVQRAKEAEAASRSWQSNGGTGSRWQDRYLVPSDKGCRWCRAAAKCPALKEKAQSLAKKVFAPDLAYDPVDLARTLDFLPILEGWIKNIREFAYGEAEKGKDIPDYKLVEKQAIRKWKEGVSPEELRKVLGCLPAEIWKPAELIGIGDAVKLAPGNNARERDLALESFVERKSSGHTLVHISDKREPVRIDAKAAFSAPALEAK
jgi:hypothetical protein